MSRDGLEILGTRGIPAKHGGFETAAEYLSRYLVAKGWQVRVYCQLDGALNVRTRIWEDVELVEISVPFGGAVSTIIFDAISLILALRSGGQLLTFGYASAFLWFFPKLLGRFHVVNMDGIEWQRSQFGRIGRFWYRINEKVGCSLADLVVADHPEIQKHLERTRKCQDKLVMIPYGCHKINEADDQILSRFGVERRKYFLVIARPEIDNSILEIVQAFVSKRRGSKLLILGKYSPDTNPYHRQIIETATEDVLFPGAVYEKNVTTALRFFALAYVHGHIVGGTNPSLLESIGAGSAIVAHRNKFNRWVAGSAAIYFESVDELSAVFANLEDKEDLVRELEHYSTIRRNQFTWDSVCKDYERTLKTKA